MSGIMRNIFVFLKLLPVIQSPWQKSLCVRGEMSGL